MDGFEAWLQLDMAATKNETVRKLLVVKNSD
jgi:hypothetical protein